MHYSRLISDEVAALSLAMTSVYIMHDTTKSKPKFFVDIIRSLLLLFIGVAV